MGCPKKVRTVVCTVGKGCQEGETLFSIPQHGENFFRKDCVVEDWKQKLAGRCENEKEKAIICPEPAHSASAAKLSKADFVGHMR